MNYATLLRIKAVESGGERFVEGFASTPQQDKVGDVVTPDGARYELPLPLLAFHDHAAPIGAVVSATVSKAGIRIRAKLTQGVNKADELWELIRDGAMSLSIGFRPIKQTPLPAGGYRFDEWRWHELSVVSVPAGEGTRVSVAKCMAFRQDNDLMQQRTGPSHSGRHESLDQVCKDFANEFFSTSLNPKSNREMAERTVSIQNKHHWTFTAGIKEALTLALFAKSHAAVLEERIAKLEAQKNIDIEVVDELAKCLEKLDMLDSMTKDRGLKFMGRWNRDVAYVRGEVASHAGALWVASRPTSEAPGACNDWAKMLASDNRGGFTGGDGA